MPWKVRARVLRYNVPVAGQIVEPGQFSRRLAEWWLPIGRFGHDTLDVPLGIACAYDDRPDELLVDFVTHDASIISAHPRVQFSISFRGSSLDEITVCERGAIPGTGVVGFERIGAEDAAALPHPVMRPVPPRRDWRDSGDLIRAVWAQRRDDFDPGDFWADKAERDRVAGVSPKAVTFELAGERFTANGRLPADQFVEAYLAFHDRLAPMLTTIIPAWDHERFARAIVRGGLAAALAVVVELAPERADVDA